MPTATMVAGPNGSGKTTLIRYMQSQNFDLGVYINADDIAAALSGSYDDRVRRAQSIADQRREACLQNGEDFTFETVMSHPSKIDFFKKASLAGFETVLFFVSTGDPQLSVARVAQRVFLGGHDVPEDRIVARYHRSMAQLTHAFAIADRAFVYQNTGPQGLALGLTKSTERLSDGKIRASLNLVPNAPDWMREVYNNSVAPRD